MNGGSRSTSFLHRAILFGKLLRAYVQHCSLMSSGVDARCCRQVLSSLDTPSRIRHFGTEASSFIVKLFID